LRALGRGLGFALPRGGFLEPSKSIALHWFKAAAASPGDRAIGYFVIDELV
jgi:hypothetical protein